MKFTTLIVTLAVLATAPHTLLAQPPSASDLVYIDSLSFASQFLDVNPYRELSDSLNLSRESLLDSGLLATEDTIRKRTAQVRHAIDTSAQSIERIKSNLVTYSDSLMARVDSLSERTLRKLGHSPIADTVQRLLKGQLDSQRQNWMQYAEDKIPEPSSLNPSLPEIPSLGEKQSPTVPSVKEKVSEYSREQVDSYEQIPSSVNTAKKYHSEIQSQSELFAKDTTGQKGMMIDQKIDQYARQQQALQPLVEADAEDPMLAIQESLQEYQPHVDQTSLSAEKVQQLMIERLQALGSDYQQKFDQRINKATRKLAKRGIAKGPVPEPDTISQLAGKRLLWGGNVRIQPGEVTQIDAAPELQYRLYPRLNIGVSGVYRVGIQINDFPHKLWKDQDTFGFRGLTEWRALGSFSLRAEWERLKTKAPVLQKPKASDLAKSQWTNSVWLGVSKYQSLSRRLKGYIQLLYNPLHDSETSPHPKPYTIRVGVQLKPSAE